MKVYVSGPMSGIAHLNYPAFHAAAKALKEAGYKPINPAENFDGDTTRSRAEYMRQDFQHVLEADAIYMLPNWEYSRGACIERAMAEDLELPIIELT